MHYIILACGISFLVGLLIGIYAAGNNFRKKRGFTKEEIFNCFRDANWNTINFIYDGKK